MKCPYCNKEMEKGYIQSKHGLGWNRKKRVLALDGLQINHWNMKALLIDVGIVRRLSLIIISRKNKIFHKRVANAVSQNWEFA